MSQQPPLRPFNSKNKLCLDALDGLFGGGTVTEGSEAEIAFTAGAEAYPRCTDDMNFCQELIEEIP